MINKIYFDVFKFGRTQEEYINDCEAQCKHCISYIDEHFGADTSASKAGPLFLYKQRELFRVFSELLSKELYAPVFWFYHLYPTFRKKEINTAVRYYSAPLGPKSDKCNVTRSYFESFIQDHSQFVQDPTTLVQEVVKLKVGNVCLFFLIFFCLGHFEECWVYYSYMCGFVPIILWS